MVSLWTSELLEMEKNSKILFCMAKQGESILVCLCYSLSACKSLNPVRNRLSSEDVKADPLFYPFY